MNIKQATTEDAQTISNIHALSWKTAYKGLIPRQYLDELKDDFWTDAFKGWIKNNTLTAQLIYENELPVGCIAYGKSRDDKFPDWGEIVSIYLLPEYFGKGHGKVLLATALADMKKVGYKNVYLWVLEDNLRARNFYERNGFSWNNDKLLFEIMGKPLTDLRYNLSFDKATV